MESIKGSINENQAATYDNLKMNGCILSICIPTYNRADALDQCIKSIVSQSGFDRRVEVVVLDNCSTDNTREVVQKYLVNYTNILYNRNESNIGMEKNIISVLKLGNGELLKLLNDYSLLTEDKLETLLSIVKEDRTQKNILYFHNDIDTVSATCNNLNGFFQKATYWPTWIGTFAIWREDFISLGDTAKFEGLLFPHLLMFLENEEQQKQIKIIGGRFFSEVKNIRKGGYDFFIVFVENFIGKIIHKLYSEKRIDLMTLYKVKSVFFKNFLRVWIANILLDKSHNFHSKNFTLLYRYFAFYPQLYSLTYYIPFIAITKNIKVLRRTLFNKELL